METASATPPTARALFKNMLKGSSLYMIAMASPNLLSLILLPIVTSRLSTADYGALDLLQQVTVVVSVLFGANFSAALGYFYFEEGAHKSRVVGTTLLGALLMGALAGSVGWMVSEPISVHVFYSPAYVPFLHLIFVAMPLGFLLDGAMGWLRIEDRATLFTGAVLLRLILILIGTLTLLLGLGLRIGAVLGANVAAGSILALVLAATALRFHGLSFDRALFVRLWRFSLPMTLSAMALFVIHFGDRFILPRYRPLADLGVYAVAYKLGMLLTPLQTAFEAYWSSQAYQIVKRPDAATVFARTFTYLALVLSAVGLGVLLATRPALRILTTPAYSRAAALVPIILAAYFIRALGDFFRIVFLAKGLPSHDAACNGIAAAVSLVSYFVLIPPYGIAGAAVATLLTFVVAFAVSYVWSCRVWRFPLEAERLMKLAVVTGAICLVYFAIPRGGSAAEIARAILLWLAFPGLLLLWRFPSPGEMDLIRSLRGRVVAYCPW